MSKRARWLAFVAGTVLVTAAACHSDSETPTAIQLALPGDSARGVLSFYGDTAFVSMPFAARVNQPVLIQIQTRGGAVVDQHGVAGCARRGTTRIAVQGSSATIEAVDIIYPPACAPRAQLFDHSVSFTFLQSGNVTLRIIGRSLPENQVEVITRQLQVH